MYLTLVNASPVRGVRGKIPDPDPMLKNLFTVYAYYLNFYLFFAHRVGFEEGLCYYGGSAIINPFGQVEVSGPYFDEGLIVGMVDESLWSRKNSLVPLRRDENIGLVLKELERISRERENS
jgi:hypothetical protein